MTDIPYLPLANGSGSPPPQNLRRTYFLKRYGPKALIALVAGGLLWLLVMSFTKGPDTSILSEDLLVSKVQDPSSATHIDYHEAEPVLEVSENLTMDEVFAISQRTKGYFSKDWSLYLGWNNMRYIIEAGLIQAKLLNRTLVIPSFVYARSCEFSVTACAALAPTVNRNDALGIETWRSRPMDEQMGWKIDVRLMFNITRVRQKHNIITVAEYLELHGLDPSIESTNGTWLQGEYMKGTNIYTKKKANLYVVENYWYDWHANHHTSRIDKIPEEWKERGKYSVSLGDKTIAQKGGWPEPEHTTEFNTLTQYLGSDHEALDMTPQIKDLMAKNNNGSGFETVHTFAGSCGIEMVKHVVFPLEQAVPRKIIRGWVDDFDHRTEDVLILTEETHADRKAGTIRFGTAKARDDFATSVIEDMHPVDKVYELARVLDQRMLAKNNGRMWLGAHMRRGDFAVLGWTMENSPEKHFQRIRDRLASARELLKTITPETAQAYKIPGLKVDKSFWERSPPQADDKFYMATDERDPKMRREMQSKGAVFIQDLLTYEDRKEFGPFILLSDVMALIEQALLARGAYFYGHCMSSFAGGIFNLRAARGDDYRTAITD